MIHMTRGEAMHYYLALGFKGFPHVYTIMYMYVYGTFFTEVRDIRAASNSAYSGYPELWILRYPAHRYCVVPSPGFEPTTLWLSVRRPNHSATTLHAVRY
jgi:hypothetical protein